MKMIFRRIKEPNSFVLVGTGSHGLIIVSDVVHIWVELCETLFMI